LARNPDLGTVCRFESPEAAGVRMWSVRGFDNYVVFHRPTPRGIDAVRVLHGARDFLRIFEQPSDRSSE
jgi:plasmid stabilization system protein ParE